MPALNKYEVLHSTDDTLEVYRWYFADKINTEMIHSKLSAGRCDNPFHPDRQETRNRLRFA